MTIICDGTTHSSAMRGVTRASRPTARQRLCDAVRLWRQRRTVGRLDDLHDQLLKDIGLRRIDAALTAFNRPGYLRPDRRL